MDPDQMDSQEASRSGSTMLSKMLNASSAGEVLQYTNIFFFCFSAALTLSLRNNFGPDNDISARIENAHKPHGHANKNFHFFFVFRYSISEVILSFDFHYSISILGL